jgi:hypothetical protein
VTKANYLTRLDRLIDLAERLGDVKTAGKLLWQLMGKQFPKSFGGQADKRGEEGGQAEPAALRIVVEGGQVTGGDASDAP